MSKNAFMKNLVMTTEYDAKQIRKDLTEMIETYKPNPVPDVDFDIFDFNHREHDLWAAINALREICREGYLPDHEWRLKEVAALLEMHLEQ